MSHHLIQLQQQMTRVLRSAALATHKEVLIEIAEDDLETLKGSNYKLCFAKKVGDTFNVVWQSYTDYLISNRFSWTPMYQLFGTNTFESDVTVVATTNVRDIGLGEQSTLSRAGVLSPAATGGPDTAITLINEYGSIHPGVNQLSTGLDGTQESTAIYVAEAAMVQGNAELTPKESVLVWFEQNVETSTMFSTARSNSVEIDLTFESEAVRLYQDQQWSTPS